MKAARLHAYGAPLQLEDVARPKPGHGQVVVRVVGCGFCHSDLHLMDGEIRLIPRFPMTLGHEVGGVIAEIGAGVTLVKEGDPVAVYGAWGCRKCDLCISGNEQLCEAAEWMGVIKDGGYAEYVLVPHEQYLVKLKKLTPREAAPLTDAALTPYRAVKRALPFVEPDHPVLAIGVGGLGQYGIQLLRLLSGAPIIALDVSPAKRELARQLGAGFTLDGKDPQLNEKIRALTEGHGVGAALDFVGSEATLATAISATRSSGIVLHVGLAGGTAKLKPVTTSKFEVHYEAPLWGNLRELRELVALVESGRLTPNPVEYAPLEDLGNVSRRMKRGEVPGRVVMTPG